MCAKKVVSEIHVDYRAPTRESERFSRGEKKLSQEFQESKKHPGTSQ